MQCFSEFPINKQNYNVERSKIGSQEGEAIAWEIELQKAPSSPPPEPITQNNARRSASSARNSMESGRPRTRAPAVQLPDCQQSESARRFVDTSAFIGSNVPTRRHANGESLRTAAMSFTRGYFVRGSFQRTPVRVKNGRKSSIDFNDGSTFLRTIAPYQQVTSSDASFCD